METKNRLVVPAMLTEFADDDRIEQRFQGNPEFVTNIAFCSASFFYNTKSPINNQILDAKS